MSKRSMRDMHAVLGIVGVIRREEGDGGRRRGEGGYRGGGVATSSLSSLTIKRSK